MISFNCLMMQMECIHKDVVTEYLMFLKQYFCWCIESCAINLLFSILDIDSGAASK